MLQSKLFYKINKDKSAEVESISHDLLSRAGFVDQLMAGVYTFLPLGCRVLKNIENIIRKPNMISVVIAKVNRATRKGRAQQPNSG